MATGILIRFFLFAYAISWAIWSPLWLPALGITGLPVLPYHHALGGFGPMIAAIICTAQEKGAAGIRALLASMLAWRPVAYLLVALLAPFVLLVISMVFHGPFDVNGIWRNDEFPQMGFIIFFLYNLVFFGFGEETGWRGFALPRLQHRMNALSASLVLSAFWALWHWPLFFYRPGYTSMDIGGIAGWVFSLITGSVLLTWLFNSTRSSLLAVAIFHCTVDIAFTCDAATSAVVGTMGMLITLCGIAMVFVAGPRNLATAPTT